jgi:hypothetical protein
MAWLKLTTTGTPNIDIWANSDLIRCFVRGLNQPTTTIMFDANHKLLVQETPTEITEKLAHAVAEQKRAELLLVGDSDPARLASTSFDRQPAAAQKLPHVA